MAIKNRTKLVYFDAAGFVVSLQLSLFFALSIVVMITGFCLNQPNIAAGFFFFALTTFFIGDINVFWRSQQ